MIEDVPFFSIITVNYNSGNMLNDTIASVAEQDFKDYEYIVIDGDSQDISRDIIYKFFNKGIIKKLVVEKDNGIYDAMNKGSKQAEGKYLLFLNADDFLIKKTTLSDVYNLIVNDGEKGSVYYGDILMVKRNDTSKIVRNWRHNDREHERLFYGGQITQPSSFINRMVFERIQFSTKYNIANDTQFFLECYMKGYVFRHLPLYVTKMRIGGTSNGSLRKSWQVNSENIKILRENGVKTSLSKYIVYRFTERIRQLLRR